MYCSSCGKPDQTADTYCRGCGAFLADDSSRMHLVNRALGLNTPQQHVTFNLMIDLVTAIVSALLVGFLMGYFDGREAKTGETAPTIIYLVYIFLGLVTIWQFISFIIGLRLKRKFNTATAGDTTEHVELPSRSAPITLPDARHHETLESVTEDSTRRLDKVRR